MAKVVVTATARAQVEWLILTHSLPADSRERFKGAVRSLQTLPELGAPLEGRWQGHRFVLGPWRWMLVVYRYREADDTVGIITIQDSRSRVSPTAGRGNPKAR